MLRRSMRVPVHCLICMLWTPRLVLSAAVEVDQEALSTFTTQCRFRLSLIWTRSCGGLEGEVV